MIAAFINKGMTLEDAAVSSVITNRFAGQIAKPNPATQIWEIIKSIPLALNEIKQ